MNDLHFYIDDSGTRHPDKNPPLDANGRDWFALGGILINSEDEELVRSLREEFCQSWGIDYPLHSSDIRFKTKNFSWLRDLDKTETDRFYVELGQLLLGSPVLGLACVIDRPGYNARYREKYGRQRWSLCKTAFSVIVERASKRAIAEGRKLRIFPERSDPDSEGKLRSYYSSIRGGGMPFDQGGAPKYQPLAAEDFAKTLREFRLKFKSSPPMQIADLYLYAICRSGYADYRPMTELREAGKLLDNQLTEKEIPELGIKYSCFELVERPA